MVQKFFFIDFMFIILIGRGKICEYLIDDGANIEAKDQDGLTGESENN